VDLNNLVRVAKAKATDTGLRFTIINDSEAFLEEFDDVQMGENNKKRIEEGKEYILIKNDEGGLTSIPIKEITDKALNDSRNDLVYLNDILAPLGLVGDAITVAGNKLVNGDNSVMLERNMREVKMGDRSFVNFLISTPKVGPNVEISADFAQYLDNNTEVAVNYHKSFVSRMFGVSTTPVSTVELYFDEETTKKNLDKKICK